MLANRLAGTLVVMGQLTDKPGEEGDEAEDALELELEFKFEFEFVLLEAAATGSIACL